MRFFSHRLSNGLRLLYCPVSNTRMTTINLMYNVGSKDEHPDHTGFAHLFEHLMFAGSARVPDFDKAIREASGENNAWTSRDVTNYYITLPSHKLDTALFLESDRMSSLNINQRSLEIQKQVVLEEFKQRHLNQPYGDVSMLLRSLAYEGHPYSWPTIGDNVSEKDWEAVMKAADQNAFIFWNHPGWKPNIEGSYEWLPFLEDLRKKNALHGIEVINGFGFHMKALDWCVDKGLTVMGTSDIHNLIGHDYDRSRKYVHRTMTLVMAKERTPESIREALDAGRTVAWASKYLAGKEENVKNLFNACVKLMPSHYSQEKNGVRTNFYEIQNKSDLYFELELTSGKGTQKITLYPMSSQLLSAEAGQQSLSYDVTNAYVRSDKFLNISFSL
jgi:hypothetical protein